MAYPFLIQGNNVVVVIGNKSHTISKTHLTYQKVLDAIKAGDWEAVKDVIEPKKVVLNYGRGNVSVQGDQLFWKGKELHNSMATRMIAMLQEGFPIEPMVNFMENLYQNPSKRAVDELYGFLEKSQLPITPDGHFLAYKKVRDDYMDCHTGTMDNSVGKIVEMERNEVDDNKDRTCSAGLHFCSLDYLNHFGGARIMIVKINPRDVVSIPSDYNDTKGRACRYEVIGELNAEQAPEEAFTAPVQTNGRTVVQPNVKSGTSAFFRGYEAGFTGQANEANSEILGEYFRAYSDGYQKGCEDHVIGVRRYRLEQNSRPAWTPV
jgi:ribosome modulation factor